MSHMKRKPFAFAAVFCMVTVVLWQASYQWQSVPKPPQQAYTAPPGKVFRGHRLLLQSGWIRFVRFTWYTGDWGITGDKEIVFALPIWALTMVFAAVAIAATPARHVMQAVRFGRKNGNRSHVTHIPPTVMIRRRLLTLASAVSFLLCAAVFLLWAFGYYVGIRADIGTETFHVTVVSSGGAIKTIIAMMTPDGFWMLGDQGVHYQFVPAEEPIIRSLYTMGLHASTSRHTLDILAWMPCWLPITVLFAAHRLFAWLKRPRISDPTPRCPDCHYDLTGNTSGVCPECGAAVAGKAKVMA
jgi:hypothetical protein